MCYVRVLPVGSGGPQPETCGHPCPRTLHGAGYAPLTIHYCYCCCDGCCCCCCFWFKFLLLLLLVQMSSVHAYGIHTGALFGHLDDECQAPVSQGTVLPTPPRQSVPQAFMVPTTFRISTMYLLLTLYVLACVHTTHAHTHARTHPRTYTYKNTHAYTHTCRSGSCVVQ